MLPMTLVTLYTYPCFLLVLYKMCALSFDSSYCHKLRFSRATNFMDFMDFWDFHENCFTKNYQKFYDDTDCRLKRRLLFY